MTSYKDYQETVEHIQTLLKECIQKISYEVFKNDRGYRVNEVLPGDNEEYPFEIGDLSGYIHTKNRKVYNPAYNEQSLSFTKISGEPQILKGIIEEIWEQWYNVFGENENIRGHPGEPPVSKEGGKQMIKDLCDMYEKLLYDPNLEDLINAIKDNNYKVSMKILGVDDTDQVLDPTVGHEMYHLFAHGDIEVYYYDNGIALVKPEYNHEVRREVERERAARRRSRTSNFSNREITVRIREDNELEEAFVVGEDDTPVGLFAHSVDGTNLNKHSTVTAQKIYNCMGFDKQYKDTKYAELEEGESMRLQGDLAVEYVSSESTPSEMDMCYVPIDNHYIALTEGQLPPDESKETEPIRVEVTNESVVNISHDEHENVTLNLTEGTYEFYLLERGLKPEIERPSW